MSHHLSWLLLSIWLLEACELPIRLLDRDVYHNHTNWWTLVIWWMMVCFLSPKTKRPERHQKRCSALNQTLAELSHLCVKLYLGENRHLHPYSLFIITVQLNTNHLSPISLPESIWLNAKLNSSSPVNDFSAFLMSFETTYREFGGLISISS